MIRVLLADDHELMRNGVKSLLGADPGIELCGEAEDGSDAIAKTAELRPNVAVLDLMMPGMRGLDVVREICQNHSDTAVVVYSIDDSEPVVREVLAAGALGYVLKNDAGVHLIDAVHAVARRELYFSSAVSEMFVRSFIRSNSEPVTAESATTPLSAREIEIMKLLAEGNSNKEIALRLFISVRTVETHRRQIFLKLNINSVAELVRYAIRNHFSNA